MNLRYRVHSASPVKVERELKLEGGGTVVAEVPLLEVELLPDGHDGGSLVVRLPGAIDELRALYVNGAPVELAGGPVKEA